VSSAIKPGSESSHRLRSVMEKSTPSRPVTAAATSPPAGAIFPPASDEVFLDKASAKAPETVYIDEQGNFTRPEESFKIEGAKEIGLESTPKDTAARRAQSESIIPFSLTSKLKGGEMLASANLDHDSNSDEAMPVSPSPAPKGQAATRPKGISTYQKAEEREY
jgi:hypothetical protein